MNEQEILRRTSRSFYLTLRLLPSTVRPDVSLGYLLARATDTIADALPVDPEKRVALLKAARASLGKPEIAGYRAADHADARMRRAEQRLLQELPALWRRMHELDAPRRALMVTMIDRILEGQIFDLERFGPDAAPLTDAEIDRYTYLVAGSVGEFWTRLCFRSLPRFCREDSAVMLSRARHYGQALQIVNILRDRRMDAALGRVYIAEHGVARWSAQARRWLGEGAAYCEALRSGRMRYATLLPALLGWRTLALLENHPEGLAAPRKVPRKELRRWMRRALPAWWSPAAVTRLAREAAA